MERVLDWYLSQSYFSEENKIHFQHTSQSIYKMKVLVNSKYRLNHSILVYSPLSLATRVVYPRIKYTDRVCSNIFRGSNTVVYIDYQYYKEIISTIRRYMMIDSRDFLTIFIKKWNCIIGTCIILPQSATRVVYPKSKYTNQAYGNILRISYTVFY